MDHNRKPSEKTNKTAQIAKEKVYQESHYLREKNLS